MNIRIVGRVVCIAALTALFSGCASPVEKALQRESHWQRISQKMIADCSGNASGLVRAPFPDVTNAVHLEIWDALKKKGVTDEGFGTICNYFGFYLVNLHVWSDFGIGCQFYDPTNHMLLPGDERMALLFYGGNKSASVTNIVRLVRYLSDTSGYRAYLITNADEIPHAHFASTHPGESLNELLLSRGILIRPPEMHATYDYDGDELLECNVFVFEPLGGCLQRYQIECRHGQISNFTKHTMAEGIGDFWMMM